VARNHLPLTIPTAMKKKQQHKTKQNKTKKANNNNKKPLHQVFSEL